MLPAQALLRHRYCPRHRCHSGAGTAPGTSVIPAQPRGNTGHHALRHGGYSRNASPGGRSTRPRSAPLRATAATVLPQAATTPARITGGGCSPRVTTRQAAAAPKLHPCRRPQPPGRNTAGGTALTHCSRAGRRMKTGRIRRRLRFYPRRSLQPA